MGIGANPDDLNGTAVRAVAQVTLRLVPPVELEDPRIVYSLPIVADQVTWEHSFNPVMGAEALGVRASNSKSHRGQSWHLIAGAPEIIRDVPAWVPAAPEGWNAFVLSMIATHSQGAISG